MTDRSSEVRRRLRLRVDGTALGVAGGAMALGYLSGAIVGSPGATAAAAPHDAEARAAEAPVNLIVADITAAESLTWSADGDADVTVVPLREQPEQIEKAKKLAAEPEMVTSVDVQLLADPRAGAESLRDLESGTELGTDDDPATHDGFTRVYTEDGVTGYVASDALSRYVEVVETAAVREVEAPSVEQAEPAAAPAQTAAPAPEPEPAPAPTGGLVGIAQSQIGSAYAFSGSQPGAFDCSGLVSWTYAQVGKYLPHSSGAIRAAGTPISAAEARPGDVIWSPGHVSIYAGGNQQVEAVGYGSGVQQTNIWQSSPVFLRF